MPLEDIEKIIRKEPIETYYDVGNELGRSALQSVHSALHLSCLASYYTLLIVAAGFAITRETIRISISIEYLTINRVWIYLFISWIYQILCRGKFAIVKRCTEKSTGTQFADKVLKKRRHGRSVRNDVLVEIDIMRQSNGNGKHPRIIKIYEVFESSHEFHIILEL